MEKNKDHITLLNVNLDNIQQIDLWPKEENTEWKYETYIGRKYPWSRKKTVTSGWVIDDSPFMDMYNDNFFLDYEEWMIEEVDGIKKLFKKPHITFRYINGDNYNIYFIDYDEALNIFAKYCMTMKNAITVNHG